MDPATWRTVNARGGRSFAVLLISVLMLAPTGCSWSATKRMPLWTSGQAEATLRKALEEQLPDDRRRAVERVRDSKYVRTEMCVKTMSVIVRTDSSQIVRRSAARALGASHQPAAFDPLLAVLDHANHKDRVRPPDAPLRRCCLDALSELLDHETPRDNSRDVGKVGSMLLGGDSDRDVRISAAHLLGRVRSGAVLPVLVESLRQPDVAVVFEAEKSLARLTGLQHGGSYATWKDWLAQGGDPFARTAQKAPPIQSSAAEADAVGKGD